jgi:hypothetical protein
MAKTSRRDFFSSVANGLHGAALAGLLGNDLYANGGVYDLTPKKSHFQPKAKAVIQLFMNGGPSQVDLFDPKPMLTKLAGTAPSKELSFAISNGDTPGVLMPSPFTFKKYGKSGMDISSAMPHLATCADDIAVIRSMYGEHANHEPALFLMHTGRTIASRPAIGSWVSYGLGTENRNLPAYVVLDDPKGLPINGISNWQSAWLPPIYQGTRFRTEGPPVLNLEPRAEIPTPLVEAERNLLRKLDAAHLAERPYQPELDARISSYELAARMQMAASDALDVNKETEATREAYGLNDPATASYGKRCLMARRLVERGVRVVMVTHSSWDQHTELEKDLKKNCDITAGPVAALIQDLKQRGMLDSTMVVWGGEFGRTPLGDFRNAEEAKAGRDHHASCFTMWAAGGGIRGGVTIGKTDEVGMNVVEDPVHVNDLQATILHCLGFDHTRLTYRHMGRDFRLTDVRGEVVRKMLA